MSWDGQSPPVGKIQKGKEVVPLKDENGKPILHFGPYMKQREEKLAKLRLEKGALWNPTEGKKFF